MQYNEKSINEISKNSETLSFMFTIGSPKYKKMFEKVKVFKVDDETTVVNNFMGSDYVVFKKYEKKEYNKVTIKDGKLIVVYTEPSLDKTTYMVFSDMEGFNLCDKYFLMIMDPNPYSTQLFLEALDTYDIGD